METERVHALSEFSALSTQIGTLQSKVATLESGFTSYSSAVDAAIVAGGADLANYQVSSATSLAQLLADYNSLVTTVREIQSQYTADVAGHVALQTAQLGLLSSDLCFLFRQSY